MTDKKRLSMNCPACDSSNTGVKESRKSKHENSIWRRRRCKDCQHCFTTREVMENAARKLAAITEIINK